MRSCSFTIMANIILFFLLFSLVLTAYLSYESVISPLCSIVPTQFREPLFDFHCNGGVVDRNFIISSPFVTSFLYIPNSSLLFRERLANVGFFLNSFPEFRSSKRKRFFSLLDFDSPCNYFSELSNNCNFCKVTYVSFQVFGGTLCIKQSGSVSAFVYNFRDFSVVFDEGEGRYFSVREISKLLANKLDNADLVDRNENYLTVDLGRTLHYHRYYKFLNLYLPGSAPLNFTCDRFGGIHFNFNIFQNSSCLFTSRITGNYVCGASYGGFCGNATAMNVPTSVIVPVRDSAVPGFADVIGDFLGTLNFSDLHNISIEMGDLVRNQGVLLDLFERAGVFNASAINIGIPQFSREFMVDLFRVHGFEKVAKTILNLTRTIQKKNLNFNTTISDFWDYYFNSLVGGPQSSNASFGSISSWIAQIFFDLFKPFFQVFIDVMGEIFMTLVDLLLDFEPYIVKLLDVMRRSVQKLVDLIYRLLLAFLAILFELVSFVDERFHLLESVLLYLFLYVYVSRNHFLNVFLVIAIVLLFGSSRYFPTLLPSLKNFSLHFQYFLHHMVNSTQLYFVSRNDNTVTVYTVDDNATLIYYNTTYNIVGITDWFPSIDPKDLVLFNVTYNAP